MQWADPSTLELVTWYLDQAPTMRALTVFTARPEFVTPWGVRSYLSQVPLGVLAPAQAEAMVAQLVGESPVATDLIRRIAARTDGIPLFVEEMTKMVLAATPDTTLAMEVPIPPTLQDALLARVDRLGPARATAQLAATVGREFTTAVLQAVGVIDEAVLQETLPQLVKAELVHQRGWGLDATYTFKHALIQDAAYQSLLKPTRQQYHQRIAHALEERFPAIKETQPELLAHHCTVAGLTEQAIDYWQAAGQRALARSANVEALRHAETGLALLATLPVTPARIPRELRLRMTFGTAVMTTKGFSAPEVEQAYERAQQLCVQIGDAPPLLPGLWGLSAFHRIRGALPTALQLAEQMFRLAHLGGDPDDQAAAHYALGSTLFWMGNFPRPVITCGTARRCRSHINPRLK